MACGLIISAGGETIWALIKKKKCAEGARSTLLLSLNLMIIMVPTQPHSECSLPPSCAGPRWEGSGTGHSWQPASGGGALWAGWVQSTDPAAHRRLWGPGAGPPGRRPGDQSLRAPLELGACLSIFANLFK